MAFNRASVHQYVYVFGLLLMLVGLSLSRFLISFGGMLIAANWLAEMGFRSKFSRLARCGPALGVLGLLLLHVLWLINTENLDYASHDLRIKLPLLLVPVVLGSSNALPRKYMLGLFWAFTATVLVGTFMAIWHYTYRFDPHTENIRHIVFFNSPIRFSLLIVVALIFLSYEWLAGRIMWMFYGLLVLWFVGFLVVLQSITGLVVIVLLGMTYGVYFGRKRLKNPVTRAILPILPLLLLSIAGYLYFLGFNDYREVINDPINTMPLEEFSATGERYIHHLENTEVENGNYIYRYIAPNELRNAWSVRSGISLDASDQRNQELYYTLLRYMSSLGLRKDAEGVKKLSERDIRQIEQGYTTAYPAKNPIVRRLRGTWYEINAYLNGASPQGGSLVQRVTYFKTGWEITRQNFWAGVGTGDVNDAMLAQYAANNSQLDEHHQRRPHNQYLTFFLTFGIFGFLYFVGLNAYLIRKSLLSKNFMAIGVSVLLALSFFAEDTLETQVGVTLFALMLGLLLMQKSTTSTGEKFRFDELG